VLENGGQYRDINEGMLKAKAYADRHTQAFYISD
jgi:hypothetical protein